MTLSSGSIFATFPSDSIASSGRFYQASFFCAWGLFEVTGPAKNDSRYLLWGPFFYRISRCLCWHIGNQQKATYKTAELYISQSKRLKAKDKEPSVYIAWASFDAFSAHSTSRRWGGEWNCQLEEENGCLLFRGHNGEWNFAFLRAIDVSTLILRYRVSKSQWDHLFHLLHVLRLALNSRRSPIISVALNAHGDNVITCLWAHVAEFVGGHCQKLYINTFPSLLHIVFFLLVDQIEA